jgi:hypothetical protein
VHCGDQREPLFDGALRDRAGDFIGNVNVIAAFLGMEDSVLRISFHFILSSSAPHQDRLRKQAVTPAHSRLLTRAALSQVEENTIAASESYTVWLPVVKQ